VPPQPHQQRHLYYPGWGISDAGCTALSAFLRLDRRMRSADLSGNKITDEGAAQRLSAQGP
jgi:hypothetical protein